MTSLRITIDAIEQIFENDVDGFLDELRDHLPEFDTYPTIAQLGLLDLLFNLGHNKFFGSKNIRGFKDLLNALKYRNWIEVAEQSHREVEDDKGEIMGGMVNRNEIIRGWFLQASEDDPFFVDPICPRIKMNNISWIPDFT